MRISKINDFLIGIFVSCIGSLPLGYLNLIALQLLSLYGFEGVFFFISGIIIVEIVVIIFTFSFAKQLLSYQKLLFWIDIFTIIFLFLLGISFLNHHFSDNSPHFLPVYLEKIHPFFIGFILNLFNFIQIPYWSSWHIFLIQSKKLNKKISIFYVLGTILGTFLGMITFVFLVNYWFLSYQKINFSYLSYVFCFILIGLSLNILIQFLKKHTNFFLFLEKK
ncbi:MAG: hypothetical protein EAZ44_00985 [Cytophagia bacterium]|nr:MAG: hypothetical protein EAZ44_00985 [Cytophagia bacterium]